MSHTILVFVNLSRQDAFVSLIEADGNAIFAAKLAAGQVSRQISTAGEKWSITSSDSFPITASDKNQVYLIGTSGVYEVDAPRAIAPESGAAISDFDFPAYGGGGWP
jgi:hypothetical protein